jgi:hypothetical protein
MPRPKSFPSHMLRQPAADLFGGVVVTQDDVFDWVAAVAPRYLSKRSFDNYVRSYDVPYKIALAKMRGEFDAITARDQSPPWHARLPVDVIRIL